MNKVLSPNIRKIAKRYDDMIYRPVHMEYFGHSDFLNYGYWDEDTTNQKEACENLMEKLISFISDKSGNILDVACGKGGSTRYLLKYYSPENITGINISERQLQTARTNAPGCVFLAMNATNLEFEDSSFDNIICVEAAFHFDTRERFLKEAHRVLKPDGCLVLSDILMTREAERRRKYRIENNYVASLQKYSKILHRIGYEEVEVLDTTEPCWKGHFWNVVRVAHQKFLSREIDKEQLTGFLRLTYLRVPDTEYYVLVAARKGSTVSRTKITNITPNQKTESEPTK